MSTNDLTLQERKARDQQILRDVDKYLDMGFGIWYAQKLVAAEQRLTEEYIWKIYNNVIKETDG